MPEGRADANSLGLARRLRRPGLPRRRSPAAVGRAARPTSASRARRCSGSRDPHGAGRTCRSASAARCSRCRRCRPRCPACACTDAAARGAARGRRPARARRRRRRRRARGRARDARCAHRPRPRRDLRRALGRAGHRRLRLGRDRARTRDWSARETALGLPVRGAPGPGEPRFVPDYFDEQPLARRRRRASTATLRADGRRQRARGRRLAGGRRAVAREVRRGHRAAERPPRGRADPRREARRAHEAHRMTDDAARAAARLARPLRQVHDLRDVLPGLERHAAVPRARSTPGRRPSASASPASRRVDASVDYCSSCGICTQVCPQGVHIAEINSQARAQAQEPDRRPAARPADRPRPTVLGRLGTPAAPIANCIAAQPPRARSLPRRDAGHPSRRAGARLRRPALPALGAEARRARRTGREGRLLPRLRRELLRARTAGQKAVELLEHNGFEVEVPKQGCCGLPLQSNGMFDDARSYVQAAGARARAARARRARHRRQRHELHADAQARGARDPRRWRTTPTSRLVSERVYDICEYLLELHDRGELRTDFRPVPRRSPTTRPASSRATGSASRPST